jgi:hypothetical protein
MEKMKTKTKTTNKNAADVFFRQNPLIRTVYVDDDGNIYLSYNAKQNLKKVIRK